MNVDKASILFISRHVKIIYRNNQFKEIVDYLIYQQLPHKT